MMASLSVWLNETHTSLYCQIICHSCHTKRQIKIKRHVVSKIYLWALLKVLQE